MMRKEDAAVLGRIIEERSKPQTIQCDNGPEFTSRAVDKWAYDKKVALDFSRTGKPT